MAALEAGSRAHVPFEIQTTLVTQELKGGGIRAVFEVEEIDEDTRLRVAFDADEIDEDARLRVAFEVEAVDEDTHEVLSEL